MPNAPAAASPVETLVLDLRTACETAPADRCTKTVIGFLDMDGNGGVSLAELEFARTLAAGAVQDRQNRLAEEERGLLGLALIAINAAKLDTVFANFDTDRSGAVAHDELFADFALDNRAFSDVVADPNAVNWQRFADRFGRLGPALKGLLPAPPAR
ncbi:MAG: hypothetical protein JJ899_08030 [Alphaproteobacteria bacterium]|nr:hypothetical protein [Alphaproteobacteria bacterium]